MPIFKPSGEMVDPDHRCELPVVPKVLGHEKAATARALGVKPDWDNLVKSTQDALLGSAARAGLLVNVVAGTRTRLPDDCRVVLGQVAKVYADAPHKVGIYVRLYEVPITWPDWALRLYELDPVGAVLDQEIP